MPQTEERIKFNKINGEETNLLVKRIYTLEGIYSSINTPNRVINF
jgi:hypothetical protein